MLTVKKVLDAVSCHLDGGVVLDGSPEKEEQALRAYNRITRRLLKESESDLSEVIICIPVHDECITLPSEILSIEDAMMGSCAELPIFHRGFQFCQKGANQFSCCSNPCLEALMDHGDHWPTQRDLPRPMHILAFSDRPEEEDAKLTVRGYNREGKDAYTFQNSIRKPGNEIPIVQGSWDNCPKFTGGDQFSKGEFESISAIQKTETNGYVSIYGYCPKTKELEWLSTLRPDETCPSYRRYRLDGCPECPTLIKTRALMRFVEATSTCDVSLIQDLEAYEAMARALTAFDDDDIGLYHALRQESTAQQNKGRARSQKGQHFKIKVSNGPGTRVHSGSSACAWWR